MIKREIFRFDIGIYTPELQEDAWLLVEFLRQRIPNADVNLESCKSDYSILNIEIESGEL